MVRQRRGGGPRSFVPSGFLQEQIHGMLVIQHYYDGHVVDLVGSSDRYLPSVPFEVGEDLVGEEVFVSICEGDELRADELYSVWHMRWMNVAVGVKSFLSGVSQVGRGCRSCIVSGRAFGCTCVTSFGRDVVEVVGGTGVRPS